MNLHDFVIGYTGSQWGRFIMARRGAVHLFTTLPTDTATNVPTSIHTNIIPPSSLRTACGYRPGSEPVAWERSYGDYSTCDTCRNNDIQLNPVARSSIYNQQNLFDFLTR